MKRRTFLIGSGTTALLLGLGLVAVRPEKVLRHSVFDLVDEATAERIGRAYLALAPHEGSPDILRDLIPADLDVALAEEFRRGDVVLLAGWMISRTEARVGALAVLERGS